MHQVNPDRCTGTVNHVSADGKCQFHSALHELRRLGLFTEPVATGVNDVSVSGVDKLRADLMMWVANNGETLCFGQTIEQWVNSETSETLAEYTKRMRLPYEWGGQIELYALTQVYRKPQLNLSKPKHHPCRAPTHTAHSHAKHTLALTTDGSTTHSHAARIQPPPTQRKPLTHIH
jgi:hypothetical protein